MIVAHRGASSAEPENTLPAFEAAVAAGADCAEFDVRLTSDGVPVVLHDARVERTTDGAGLVRALSLRDVKRLRVRTASGGSVEVPTLAEVLSLLSGRAAVDIEVKNIPGEPDFDPEAETVVEATVRVLEASGFAGLALVSSFNPRSIARARELAPDVPTGLLTIEGVDARTALGYASEQGHPWALPQSKAVFAAGEGFVREAHRLGMRVGTWIVDEPRRAVEALRWGIDVVATNDPATIVAAAREAFG